MSSSNLVNSRRELASLIVEKLAKVQNQARQDFRLRGRVPSFYVDDLLPPETASRLFSAFPGEQDLVLKKTLGQLKFVGYQLDRYDPILEEAIYAFQDQRVVDAISSITNLKSLLPDEHLYAGGISVMAAGHFLNPHLDNSHDQERQHYRVLNLLYYVTPGWSDDSGGNLELWDSGPGSPQRTIHSRFNRLVVMQTDERSWHSVSRIHGAGKRCCISNYYFSDQPAGVDRRYHVTSFRGWPEEKFRDLLMRTDSTIRLVVRKLGGNWAFKNPHVYKKQD